MFRGLSNNVALSSGMISSPKKQGAVRQVVYKRPGRVGTVGFLLQVEVTFDQGVQTKQL